MEHSYSHINAQQARAIISGVQNGNRQHFEKLYDNYAPLLLGAIIRIVKDEPLAASVLKDTFIKVRKDMIEGYCTEDNLCTWMLSIARKLSLQAKDTANVSEDINSGTDSALNMVLQKGYTLEQASEELNLTKDDLCKKMRMKLINNWK